MQPFNRVEYSEKYWSVALLGSYTPGAGLPRGPRWPRGELQAACTRGESRQTSPSALPLLIQSPELIGRASARDTLSVASFPRSREQGEVCVLYKLAFFPSLFFHYFPQRLHFAYRRRMRAVTYAISFRELGALF